MDSDGVHAKRPGVPRGLEPLSFGYTTEDDLLLNEWGAGYI